MDVQHQGGAVAVLDVAVMDGDLGQSVRIAQFQSTWLILPEAERLRLSTAFCTLGVGAMAGERAWDVRNRFRIVIGLLTYPNFDALMPSRVRLARVEMQTGFHIGEVLGFDVQLILKREDVPECQLAEAGSSAFQPRLG